MFDDSKEDWGDAQETRDETSGGTWLRLKDGEKALVVFPTPPFAYRQVWIQEKNTSEIYDPDRHDGMRPSGRFAFPVFVPVAGRKEYVAQVFDASGETFDAIKECRDKYGAKHLYEVTRKGTGTDTKYRVLPERPLAEGEVTYLLGLELADAKGATLGGEEDTSDAPPPPVGEDPWEEDADAKGGW